MLIYSMQVKYRTMEIIMTTFNFTVTGLAEDGASYEKSYAVSDESTLFGKKVKDHLNPNGAAYATAENRFEMEHRQVTEILSCVEGDPS